MECRRVQITMRDAGRPRSWCRGIATVLSAGAKCKATFCARRFSDSRANRSRRSGCRRCHSSRPVLRTVQDAHDMHGIAPDLIDDDVRQRGHHQFTRSLLLACTATVWEALQGGWRVVEFAYQARSVFGRFLEEVICDVL